MNKNEITVVDRKLQVQKNTIDKIVELEKAKKEIEEQEKKLKEELYNLMYDNVIYDYVSDDGKLVLQMVEDTRVETFDKEQFKKDNPVAYKNYIKVSKRKGYVKIKINEEVHNEQSDTNRETN